MECIAFLEQYVRPFPKGTFVQICTMKPDRGSIFVKSAPADDIEQLRSFVGDHQSDRNIYFGINPLKRGLDKKASKDDISHVCYFQADIDPASSASLHAERERIRAAIDRAHPEPTVVIDSGGGYQVLYRLAKPIHVNGDASELERGSKALEKLFGADHCANIDRIFRLPGTTNFPNRVKRRKGRAEAPAEVIRFSDATYDLKDFQNLTGDESLEVEHDDRTITRQIPICDIDIDELALSPVIRQLIRTGKSLERDYSSRSEAMMAVIRALRRAGYDDRVVFSVCLDTKNAISAHAWDQGDADKAQRAVERVLNKIDAVMPVARSVVEKLDRLTAEIIHPAPRFVARRLSKREQIVDVLIAERSLTLIAGAKSIGKSLLVLMLLGAIATGCGPFLGFRIVKARRCLYVDGEMPAKELQERLKFIFGSKAPIKLEVLSSEDTREVLDGSLKINNPLHQAAFMRVLEELEAAGRRPEVIAFDNLSTLCMGMDENSNSGEMDHLIEFFMRLRHAGYAVIFVHHLNKQGSQRGGNRKEDPVDVSIVLSRLSSQRQNAAFRFWIKDIRGERPKPDRFVCELGRDPKSGLPKWHVESMPESRGWVATLVGIANLNPEAQKDLVNLLGITKSVASKHVKTLRSKGLVAESSLTLTPKGKAYLETVAKCRGDALAWVVSEDKA